MPTQEDDIEALLTQIKDNSVISNQNTLSTANNTALLLLTCQSGFQNLAAGMAVQIQLQQQANKLLYTNDQQNAVIICWLKNIAQELCKILNLTHDEVELQTEIKTSLSHVDHILELVHAREAMEVMKTDAIEQRMEECCPHEKPEPVPCYKECETPRPMEYKPVEVDWKPVHFGN